MIIALLATAACHVGFAHGLPAPDNSSRCTPSSFDILTRSQACTAKTRPALKAADRRQILTEYGVPNWTGADGELDHRVPVWLGGRTEPLNVWPEPDENHFPGYRNAKDRVEFRAYRRVCFRDPYGMRVRTARRVFLGDWRVTYRAWKEDGVL